MKKLAKTLAVFMDVLCTPIRWIVTLQVGIVMLILYDDYETSDLGDLMRSNLELMYIVWKNTPAYLIKIWKGEKIEIL